jgi:hypothetical protein
MARVGWLRLCGSEVEADFFECLLQDTAFEAVIEPEFNCLAQSRFGFGRTACLRGHVNCRARCHVYAEADGIVGGLKVPAPATNLAMAGRTWGLRVVAESTVSVVPGKLSERVSYS